MLKGSCHCGTVRFEIGGALRNFMHCHCHTCRKINGTVFGSSAVTDAAGFRVVAGAEALTDYRSSPGKSRFFCSKCGAHVYARMDHKPGDIILRMGTLDSTFEDRPGGHIWVSHKAPWYDILDDLLRHEAADY